MQESINNIINKTFYTCTVDRLYLLFEGYASRFKNIDKKQNVNQKPNTWEVSKVNVRHGEIQIQ